MHFGQYLLKKKVIEKEQLIEALIYQLDHLPSLLSILHENKVFNPDKLLEIIQCQIEESSDLLSVLKRHSFLTENELKKILERQSKKRIPIGQIFVKRKYLIISDAQRLLTDYLNSDDAVSTRERDGRKSGEGTKIEVVVDIPEFLKCFEQCPIEEGVVNDYLELLDENKKDSLEMTVMSWPKLYKEGKAQNIKNSFKDFYRELHTMKGTARFLKAHVSEFVIHHLEELLSTIQHAVNGLKDEDYELIESLYLKGIDVAWELRNEMQSALSEQKLWENNDWKGKCINFLQSVEEFKQKTEQIEVAVSVDAF